MAVIRKADIRVRARIFSYLRANGFSPPQANRVASRLVRAMVDSGKLSQKAATLIGAAISKPVNGEKAVFGLLEPKAEPFEIRSKAAVNKATGPKIGRSLSKFSRLKSAHSNLQKFDVNFAEIEPVRRLTDVQKKMGSVLTRTSVLGLVQFAAPEEEDMPQHH